MATASQRLVTEAALATQMATKAGAAHGHNISEVSGLQSKLDAITQVVSTVSALPSPSGNSGQVYYVTATRQQYMSDGVMWSALGRVTVDQSVGRVIKIWDYANLREQVVYGDTGLRDISSLITKAASVGSATLQRIGMTVTVNIIDLVTSDAGAHFVSSNIPTGFRPGVAIWETVATTAYAVRRTSMTTNGLLGVYGGQAGETMSFSMSYPVNSPWPTTLPGTAIGSIPA